MISLYSDEASPRGLVEITPSEIAIVRVLHECLKPELGDVESELSVPMALPLIFPKGWSDRKKVSLVDLFIEGGELEKVVEFGSTSEILIQAACMILDALVPLAESEILKHGKPGPLSNAALRAERIVGIRAC